MSYPAPLWVPQKYLLFFLLSFMGVISYKVLRKFLLHRLEHKYLEILHHSRNFLVIMKPHDMVINSNDPHVKVSLKKVQSTLQDICYYFLYSICCLLFVWDFQESVQIIIRQMFPQLVNPKLYHEFYFVHRLDFATSGVMCLALNKLSAQVISTAFSERKVEKYYLALVHGHINEDSMLINEPIGFSNYI